MKKLYFFFCFCLVSVSLQAQAVRISVANGLATNPLVWNCTCLPLPGDSIIINHNITLNNNFANYGAVVINTGGKLIGDDANRAFVSTGYFENKGEFNVARVALLSGSAVNLGYFGADSLFTSLNASPLTNTGGMYVQTSFWNTGKYTLTNSAAELVVRDNFYNGDSLITGINAVLVNNGRIRVNQDFANSDTIRGSGQICIDGNSLNAGVITGTIDLCDISSGSIDLNIGTISPSVQFCQAECTVSLNEAETPTVEVFPNPFTDQVVIRSEKPATLRIYDLSGKLVYTSPQESVQHTVSTGNWKNGVYMYSLVSGGASYTGKMVR